MAVSVSHLTQENKFNYILERLRVRNTAFFFFFFFFVVSFCFYVFFFRFMFISLVSNLEHSTILRVDL